VRLQYRRVVFSFASRRADAPKASHQRNEAGLERTGNEDSRHCLVATPSVPGHISLSEEYCVAIERHLQFCAKSDRA
jgi:hypothetical protein